MILYIPIMFLVILGSLLAEALLKEKYSRTVASAASASIMLIVFYILFAFHAQHSVNMTESLQYINTLNIHFGFIISQTTLILLILTSIVSFAAIVGGNFGERKKRAANSLILLFELSAIGLFTSANLFLFFIFWDIGVIAVFFMISYLGTGNRKNSAKNYLIYSLFASAMLLFGILLIYFYTPIHSFNINTIISYAHLIPQQLQELIFFVMLIAFMIKMPIFPLHSWMSDAYSDASTQGSIILAGLLSKFGAYGMFILFMMMPISHEYMWYILILAIVSAFYAAFNAIRNTDMKRMAAYTGMIESSLIFVGIAAGDSLGKMGAIFAILAYGLAISLMFLSIGSMNYIFGSRDLRVLRGVVKDATSSAYSFLISVFTATGVPLTVGFIADILIFLGAYKSFGFAGLIPLITIIIMGGYLYYAVNRSILSTEESSDAVRFGRKYWNAGFMVLLLSIFIFGIFPSILLGFKVI